MMEQSVLPALEIYEAAVAAAAPGPHVAAAVAALPLEGRTSVWLFAIGKAAHPMAAGAIEALRGSRVGLAGGLIVSPERAPSPHASLEVMTGEHPIPGRGSFAAGQRLAELARGMRSSDAVIVLVSGGATSLIAAPVRGVAESELAEFYTRLLARGLPIAEMNAIRKRFSRWGGGRLAVAVAPATTWCIAISDVVGDEIEAIGSGPCSPDACTATDVQRMLERAGLLAHLPPSMRKVLEQTPRGLHPETPKPRHPAFAHVLSQVVLTNRDALEGAAAHAQRLGYDVEVVAEPLTGEAAEYGVRIARALIEKRRGLEPGARRCVLWGGEPTVNLAPPPIPVDHRGRPLTPPSAAPPPGGRCQELALSAARALDGAGDAADGIRILAAGTDGRDGSTDAAGAVVDRTTWHAISEAGHDPSHALLAHDAHRALASVGALIRPGPTGTNVMDVVVGLIDA